MVINYRQEQKQLRQKQAEEWESFRFFQAGIHQLMKQRHAEERRVCYSLAQQTLADRRHKQESVELAQAKELALGLLQEKHNQEKAILKLAYQRK